MTERLTLEAVLKDEISGKLNHIKTGLLELAGAAGIAFGFHKVLEAGEHLEKFRTQLEVVTGSVEGGKKAFEDIGKAAEEVGGHEQLMDAYIKLNKYGITPTIEQLKSFKDIATVAKGNVDDLAGAIGKAVKGKYKGLYTGFGVNIEKIKGDHTKLKASFHGITTTVDNTSKGITDYITKLGEMKGVHGASAEMMKTVSGQMELTKESFEETSLKIVDSLKPAITWFLTALRKIMEYIPPIIEFFKEYKDIIIALSVGIASLITMIGLYIGVMKAIAIYTKIAIIWKQTLIVMTEMEISVTAALNAVLMLNPYILIAAGVALLILGFTYLMIKMGGLKMMWEKVSTWIKADWEEFKILMDLYLVQPFDALGAMIALVWKKLAHPSTTDFSAEKEKLNSFYKWKEESLEKSLKTQRKIKDNIAWFDEVSSKKDIGYKEWADLFKQKYDRAPSVAEYMARKNLNQDKKEGGIGKLEPGKENAEEKTGKLSKSTQIKELTINIQQMIGVNGDIKTTNLTDSSSAVSDAMVKALQVAILDGTSMIMRQ